MVGASQGVPTLRNDWEGRAGKARACVLEELATAIECAQRVAWLLGSAEDASLEARQLYGELEAVRVELEALRLANRRIARGEMEPWLARHIGWPGALSVPRAEGDEANDWRYTP